MSAQKPGQHERTLSKADVQQILATAEIEMKKRRRIKLQREASIGRISLDLKKLLNKKIESRVDRKTLAARLILKENNKAQSLFGSLSGKKGGLASFLKQRPTKTSLVALNIISEEKEGVCPAEKVDLESKRKLKRKENLQLLLGSRPSVQKLREKKILLDMDTLEKNTKKAKLESFLKRRPMANNPQIRSVISDRKKARRKSMSEASAVLGGFLKSRSKPNQLKEKKILQDISHIRVPHIRLGEIVTFQQISLSIKIKQVSCGWGHSMMIDEKGLLYAFGMGADGRLGLGTKEDKSNPTVVSVLSAVTMVACGDNHTIATTKDGSVYTWGLGLWGRLGLGDEKAIDKPTKVSKLPSPAKSVAAGAYHSLVCSHSGQVFGFGSNRQSQVLGMVSTSNLSILEPAEVEGVRGAGALKVCAGVSNSGILTESGEVYLWGGNRALSGSAAQLEAKIKASKQVKTKNTCKITKLAIKDKVVSLDFGPTHCIAVTKSSVLSWGSNTFGELGRDSKMSTLPGPVDDIDQKTASAVEALRYSF
ncbi:hypothetical protein AAMO2058_001696300 [Amorphochlora amoebiformis]